MLADFFQINWRVGLIILSAIVLYVFIDSFGKRAWVTALLKLSRKVEETAKMKAETLQRVETISSVFAKTSKVIVVMIAFVMLLSEWGVNIVPFITGAGIVGVAFGFGAQSLIKDVVAGVFVIIERQYSKGDEVSLGEVRGTVIHFSLRTTVLCDEANVEHYIPNGTVTHVANFSKRNKNSHGPASI